MAVIRSIRAAAPAGRSRSTGWPRRAWACWWTALLDHVADLHRIPRDDRPR